MKRYIWVFVLAFGLCVLLCGCNLWLDGQYYSATPHLEENSPADQDSSEVNSYADLRNALVEMVEDGATNGVIYAPDFTQEQLESYIQMAKQNAMENNAIGAYAVDELTYEIGTNTGRMAIAVQISYNHGRSEILRIKQTKNMKEASNVIEGSLENCDAGVVLCVNYYEDTDFTQLVQDYVDANPQVCMEMPQVSVAVYPESGPERVVEITYTYQTSRETLRSMQETVEPLFSSARLYVTMDADNWEKYAQLYSFLMGRDTYTVETSITPAYSLLRHGVGDSKAFATVYAAMCRQAGLNCQVVSGTREGAPWCWNVLLVDDVYYHVDLLQSSQSGGFQAKTEADMSGYVWDYSAYTQDAGNSD